MKSVIVGGGCFWCVEAIYQRVKGVEAVESGYAGGTAKNPDYYNHYDHAEVIRITYNEDQINLKTLLEVFFHVHDPTTLNRQNYDVGTQYRSIILVNDETELKIAKDIMSEAQKDWDKPIVTEIKQLDEFYMAEDYHQDYYNQNPANGYCQVIINPKLAKFQAQFKELLKD